MSDAIVDGTMTKIQSIRRIERYLFGLLILMCIIVGASAFESEQKADPFEADADVIVLGSIISVDSHWTPDHLNIETTAEIKVNQVLKSNLKGATVMVTVPGGTVDNITQVEFGAPVLENGTIGRFILRADETGHYYLKGQEPATLTAFDESGATYVGYASNVNTALAPETAGGPQITSVSPQIASAGTGTVITITGTGFGTKASRFSMADVGFLTSAGDTIWASGRNYASNVNDIVFWSDTKVQVRVPTGKASDGYYSITAGSGEVWIVTDALTVSNHYPFAVSFGYHNHKWINRTANFSVNDNCPGVTGSAEAIRRAAATWNSVIPAEKFQIDCSATSHSTTYGYNGESLISWRPLGSTEPFKMSWFVSGNQILEADIILARTKNWTTGEAGGSVYSIESEILQDLGSCIGLSTVAGTKLLGPADTSKAMLPLRSDRYGNMNLLTLHPADRAGINYIYNGGDANPPLLAAAFNAGSVSGPAPLDVQFSDATIGGATSWTWDFGDGATSTLPNPSHTYTRPGIFTITLTASAPGLPSDTIKAIDLITVNATTSVLQIPTSSGIPLDLNANGLYEDVNGNGRSDFADVVLYFNQMAWIAANEPVSAFDYNGNGRIDFADVVWLFNHL